MIVNVPRPPTSVDEMEYEKKAAIKIVIIK